jgi:hypothetical protein
MLHPTERQRIAIGIVAGVGLGCIIALFVWGLISNHERTSEIQHSRILSAESSCLQQNERHEQLFEQIEATAQEQRIREPAKYRETVAKGRELELLLNAIQPAEDCKARARMLVEETLHHKHAPKQKPIREPGPLRLAP